MEKLIVLGTGNASVYRCYNTCSILQDAKGRYFMIDAGGGNGILTQLDKKGISIADIHEMFLTHEHTDHLLGVVWMIRSVAQMIGWGTYEGDFHLYCHDVVAEKLRTICDLIISPRQTVLIDKRIHIHVVEDGEERQILDYKVKFFDIRSTKAKQFGFVTTLNNGKKFMFCGDEPYKEHCYEYAYQADWFLHEAFCRYEDREIYNPYDIQHSTVKDAAELASQLQVKNLLLWHTEDDHIRRRKSLYKKEARTAFKGNVYVPYDLEEIEL